MNRMRKLPDGSRTFGTEIRMMATAQAGHGGRRGAGWLEA